MAQQSVSFQNFNRGAVSPLALARTDVDRLRLSAEVQTNFMPLTIGPMMLRPGTENIGRSRSFHRARCIPFVFSAGDTALMELTDTTLRVRVDEAYVHRNDVATTVNDFTGTHWTAVKSSGSETMVLDGNLRINAAVLGGDITAYQQVTVAAGDQTIEHALSIKVNRGPVTFRVGTTSTKDDLIEETTLDNGWHSLAFTPNAASFYIQFETTEQVTRIVGSCVVETGGPMNVTTPWAEANLDDLRWSASADVTFVACDGVQNQRIERRGVRSWSVVRFRSDDGPFGFPGDDTVKLTPSDVDGNITITASKGIFRSGHVGALLRLFENGQNVSASIAAENTFSDPVRVTGTKTSGENGGSGRKWTLKISGNWNGKLTLQRSFDGPASGFADFRTFRNNGSTTINDPLENSIVYYRIGFKTGDYTSGTAQCDLSYDSGGGYGIARITDYTDRKTVSAEVLDAFSNTDGTNDWRISQWSDEDGWPSAVCLHEGRLWWAGQDRIWGSVSDAYDSFDLTTTGDAGPINRSIGEGPIADIHWLLSLQRMAIGTDAATVTARSNSFDEPLTPTNFNLRQTATRRAASAQAVKVDSRGIMIDGSTRRIYEIAFDAQSFEYITNDLTRLNPDIGLPGFRRLVVQRQPDTRVHCLLEDGTVAVLLYDVQDEAEAWWLWETNGFVDDIAVLPGPIEDKVYYSVKRTINGNDAYFLDRASRIDECKGGLVNKQADSALVYQGVATTVITGLSHLDGYSVVVWGDGKDLGTYTVNSDQVTLPVAVENAVVGLGYTAQYKSTKLAYAAQMGTAINQVKRVNRLGVIAGTMHAQGLKYGPDFDHLDDLPKIEDGAAVSADYVWSEYDQQQFPFGGSWDTDARFCLQASAPRPCVLLGCTIEMTTHG